MTPLNALYEVQLPVTVPVRTALAHLISAVDDVQNTARSAGYGYIRDGAAKLWDELYRMDVDLASMTSRSPATSWHRHCALNLLIILERGLRADDFRTSAIDVARLSSGEYPADITADALLQKVLRAIVCGDKVVTL